MRKIKSSFILFGLLIFASPLFGQGQAQTRFSYRVVTLDSNYAQHPDSAMSAYLNSYKRQLDEAMSGIIGRCDKDLRNYPPQSELSNLLTDMLYNLGNHICNETMGKSADMSLLNFGGIRCDVTSGDITLGTLYSMLPFDNTIVIITLKGRELQKMFNRFTDTQCQPYANAQVVYENHQPALVKVNHKKVKPNKSYRLVTIDFIQIGGDKILEGVQFENVIETHILLREAMIDCFKDYQKNGLGQSNMITGKLDRRVIIK